MNDEAAESRGPATTGTGPSQDRPASSVPSSDGAPAPSTSAPEPPAPEPPAPGAGAADVPPPPPPPGAGPTPPGGEAPPGAGQVPPTAPPPWFGGADGGPTFAKENLIRPNRGRYVAGVCAALGRATNTDPVLWRVLLAVLGFFGGVGVLIYLIGWLVIPGEDDSASPIESLLGRGRSAMAPFSIVLLAGAAVLTFVFVVNDGFRAALLAAAVLIGATLLLKRNAGSASGFPPAAATHPAGASAAPAGASAAPGTSTSPSGTSAFSGGTAAFSPGSATVSSPGDPTAFSPGSATGSSPDDATAYLPGSGTASPAGATHGGSPQSADPTVAFDTTATGPAAGTAPAEEPVTAPLPPLAPQPSAADAPPLAPRPPSFQPPKGGYRPPFAPHGPWAGTTLSLPKPPQFRPAKAPKPPREKSKLGRITFFGVVMVLGVLAMVDTAGFSVPVSAYFAAALATVALGLIVGAWFGRARGLIALALVAAFGLGISSGVERFGGQITNSVYRPQTITAVADRYDFTLGNATVDLRDVDFTGAQQETTVAMRAGQVKVLLPANVDTTADVRINNGRAYIFGRESDGRSIDGQTLTDLGGDGAGGGSLHLIIDMNAGNVEVIR